MCQDSWCPTHQWRASRRACNLMGSRLWIHMEVSWNGENLHTGWFSYAKSHENGWNGNTPVRKYSYAPILISPYRSKYESLIDRGIKVSYEPYSWMYTNTCIWSVRTYWSHSPTNMNLEPNGIVWSFLTIINIIVPSLLLDWLEIWPRTALLPTHIHSW